MAVFLNFVAPFLSHDDCYVMPYDSWNIVLFLPYQLRAMYNAFDNFCDLPEDVRNRFRRISPCNHGYVSPGVERFSKEHVEELRHTFNICWLDKNLPEAEVQGFQALVASLAKDFQKLANLLLRALALSL